MDFTIEEYNEEVHLTIIEETDTLEFSIEETVEELNLVIEEYHGADGAKGEKPNHQWNGTSLRFENPDDTWGNYVDLKGTTVTKTSDLVNDGADGINPYISLNDIPAVDVSTKAETDASNIDPYLHIWRQKIDSNYVHDQAQPSSIWTINHPLNKKVSVTITDTAGTVVEGRVTINDGNKVVIEFNFPFSGEAILN